MIKDHMASMPCLPRTVRKSWPIGSGRSVERMSVTDVVANEAAIKSNQPSEAVAKTLMRIAIGAARAAPAVSSAMCAAESSRDPQLRRRATDKLCTLTSCEGPHRCCEGQQESPTVCVKCK
jgi:hypothetical protein